MNLIFKYLIIVFFLFGLIQFSNSQTTLLIKDQLIHTDSLVMKFDTVSVYQGSVIIENVDPTLYEINYISAILILKDTSLIGKNLHISYQAFDFSLATPLFHKKIDLISVKGNSYKQDLITYPLGAFQPFNESNTLESNGSIARSFSIGNNQDFVLNSTMNIQLSGFLAPDLEVKANITDKNIPVQSEGNTRVIQDFDKIFIELNYKNKWKLHAGDIDIQKPNSHFLFLTKKIMGMEFQTNLKLQNTTSFQSNTGGGISKGKYTKQKLNLLNGKQGPYKLTGNDLNATVLVLSGSERVYMDNKLLVRGMEFDYTMDYNTGEITFTAKNLITSEKEINIEYEYSELSYSRYSLYSFNQFKSEKTKNLLITVNFFNEQDLKNNSIQPTLTDSMKSFMSILQDGTSPLYPGIDTSSYYPGEILYIIKDTIVDLLNYTIYEYSTDQTVNLYRLNFSYLGENQGNYVLVSSGTNGRVFRWIAPVNNTKQGDYEPVIKLVLPKLEQMGTIGLQYEISPSLSVNTEFAFSNNDQNLFSDLDDQDNIGYSYFLKMDYHKKLNQNDSLKYSWLWTTNMGYEFVNKNFNPIENYRSVEFYKDYNLTNDYSFSNHEHMLSLSSAISNSIYGESKYQFNFYSIQKQLTTLRNQIVSNHSFKGFNFQTNTSFLLNEDTLHNSRYLRTLNNFSKKFKQIESGIYERFESNIYKKEGTQSLESNSFRLNELYWYIQNADSIKYQYKFLLKNFIEDNVAQNQLMRNQIAYEAQTNFELFLFQNQSIRGVGTFRKSYFKDSLNVGFSEDFFVGSLEYKGRFFKNALSLSTYYDAGSGIEQKKIYSFIKVAMGQGTHIWNDYNGNGLEELNEFEIAVFQNEADYIKVWITSNEYISSYTNTFVQTIQFRPSLLWGNKKGILKIISGFNNSTLLRIFQKNTQTDLLQAINPFIINAEDTTILTSNIILNNTLTFNQSTYWSVDYYFKYVNNKLFLYYGPEWNTLKSNEVLLRIKLWKKILIKTSVLNGYKSNNSTFFETNNYHISVIQSKSDFQVTLNSKILININYTYKFKNNIEGVQKLLDHEVEIELNYRSVKKRTWVGKFKYLYLNSSQNLSGNIGYEMLEGLSLGKNMVWSFTYQLQISEYLFIDFQYNGRISEISKSIHFGNLQLKVIF
jgi:hypothetical protein